MDRIRLLNDEARNRITALFQIMEAQDRRRVGEKPPRRPHKPSASLVTHPSISTNLPDHCPPAQECCPPAQECCPPTKECCPPTQECCPPTQECCSPTQDSCSPTQKSSPCRVQSCLPPSTPLQRANELGVEARECIRTLYAAMEEAGEQQEQQCPAQDCITADFAIIEAQDKRQMGEQHGRRNHQRQRSPPAQLTMDKPDSPHARVSDQPQDQEYCPPAQESRPCKVESRLPPSTPLQRADELGVEARECIRKLYAAMEEAGEQQEQQCPAQDCITADLSIMEAQNKQRVGESHGRSPHQRQRSPPAQLVMAKPDKPHARVSDQQQEYCPSAQEYCPPTQESCLPAQESSPHTVESRLPPSTPLQRAEELGVEARECIRKLYAAMEEASEQQEQQCPEALYEEFDPLYGPSQQVTGGFSTYQVELADIWDQAPRKTQSAHQVELADIWDQAPRKTQSAHEALYEEFDPFYSPSQQAIGGLGTYQVELADIWDQAPRKTQSAHEELYEEFDPLYGPFQQPTGGPATCCRKCD